MEKNRIALFEFRRLWSLAWVVALLAAGLFALDSVLRFGAGPAPAILAVQARVNPRKRARMLDAIASAERRMEQEQQNGEASSSPVCLIIGSSSAKTGLDESVLSGPAKPRFKVLNLSGNALGFQELDYFIKGLERSALKPGLLLVAIHPVFIIDARTAAPTSSIALAPGTPLKNWLKSRWALANLSGMHALFHNQFMEIRFALLRRFGLPASVQDSPPEGGGSEYSPVGPHASAKVLDLEMRHWEQIGAFDPLQYQHLEEETRVLEALLRRSCSWAPRTAILLMPERSDFRGRVPPEATARLRRSAAADDASCLVLDFQDAIPDPGFFDFQHLNPNGRAELSRKVGERIANLGSAH